MRVMGIDSSMNNCGWSVFDLDETNITNETYKNMLRVSGGTFKEEDTKDTKYTRMIRNVQKVQHTIDQYQPDIIILEDCLSVGDSKSPTGMAVCALLLQPYHPVNSNYSENSFTPSYIVLISPERLQSMAHKERKTSGSKVVKRAKERFTHLDLKRFTEHEADSMFLAYHGTRFIMSCVRKEWSQTILDEQEKWVFLEATGPLMAGRGKLRKKVGVKQTSLIANEGSMWWQHPGVVQSLDLKRVRHLK